MANIEYLTRKGVLWDPIDDPIVLSGTWAVSRVRNTYYVFGTINGRRTSLHRAIMRPRGKKVVDHKNGNGLDNRRQNMRIVTNAQNCRHRHRQQRNNTSGHRGVFFDKRVGRWLVKFMVDGKYHYLGWYDSVSAAAKISRAFLARQMLASDG